MGLKCSSIKITTWVCEQFHGLFFTVPEPLELLCLGYKSARSCSLMWTADIITQSAVLMKNHLTVENQFFLPKRLESCWQTCKKRPCNQENCRHENCITGNLQKKSFFNVQMFQWAHKWEWSVFSLLIISKISLGFRCTLMTLDVYFCQSGAWKSMSTQLKPEAFVEN